jgi:predicted transcriptional regulator
MSASPDENVSITFRTERQKREALDRIAKSMDRDRSYILNQAIDYYLELHDWQLQQIERGIHAAEGGDFLTEDEIRAAIAKWTS